MNSLGTDKGWQNYLQTHPVPDELQEAFDDRTRTLEPITKHAPSLLALHEQPGFSFEGRLDSAERFMDELTDIVDGLREANKELQESGLTRPGEREAHDLMARRLQHANAGLLAGRAQIARLRTADPTDRQQMLLTLQRILLHLRSDQASFDRLIELHAQRGSGLIRGGRMGYIYKITSAHTPKVYVGSTWIGNLDERLRRHKSLLKSYRAGTFHYVTSMAITKHPDAKISLLQKKNVSSLAQLLQMEGHWQNHYKPRLCNKCMHGGSMKSAFVAKLLKKARENAYSSEEDKHTFTYNPAALVQDENTLWRMETYLHGGCMKDVLSGGSYTDNDDFAMHLYDNPDKCAKCGNHDVILTGAGKTEDALRAAMMERPEISLSGVQKANKELLNTSRSLDVHLARRQERERIQAKIDENKANLARKARQMMDAEQELRNFWNMIADTLPDAERQDRENQLKRKLKFHRDIASRLHGEMMHLKDDLRAVGDTGPPPGAGVSESKSGHGLLSGASMTDVDYCLSDSDIKRVAGSTGMLIIRYPELAKFSSWDDFLSNRAHAAAVLFLVEGPTSGHWIAAFDGPDDTAHVWDPLGMALDAQRSELSPDKLEELGQTEPQFARLLATAKADGQTPVVNHVEFQDFRPSVNTCGRWVGLRILHRDKTDAQFKQFVLSKVRESSCSTPDEWVVQYTNPTLTGSSMWLNDVSVLLGGLMPTSCNVTLTTNTLPADYKRAPGKLPVAFYSSETERRCIGVIPTGLSQAEATAAFVTARKYLRSSNKYTYYGLRDPSSSTKYKRLTKDGLVTSVATAKSGVIQCLTVSVSKSDYLLRSCYFVFINCVYVHSI